MCKAHTTSDYILLPLYTGLREENEIVTQLFTTLQDQFPLGCCMACVFPLYFLTLAHVQRNRGTHTLVPSPPGKTRVLLSRGSSSVACDLVVVQSCSTSYVVPLYFFHHEKNAGQGHTHTLRKFRYHDADPQEHSGGLSHRQPPRTGNCGVPWSHHAPAYRRVSPPRKWRCGSRTLKICVCVGANAPTTRHAPRCYYYLNDRGERLAARIPEGRQSSPTRDSAANLSSLCRGGLYNNTRMMGGFAGGSRLQQSVRFCSAYASVCVTRARRRKIASSPNLQF